MRGYAWSVGATRAVCEYPGVTVSGLITTCWIDRPIPTSNVVDPDASFWVDIQGTPDDFPRFPTSPVASARMYAFESEHEETDASCDDPRFTNVMPAGAGCTEICDRTGMPRCHPER